MTLSITDNIPNPLQIPTCKQSLQVRFHCEALRDAGRISAEVAKTLALTEYEKYNAARLEREALEPDEDFDKVVKQLKTKSAKEGNNK